MHLSILAFLVLPAVALAKPKKAEPAPAPVLAAPTPAAEPEPAPPPPPPPPEEPSGARNVSFTISLTRADGSSRSGHVKGIERSADFHADQGWESGAKDITFEIETAKGEKVIAWTDVKSISIAAGKMPDDVDCTYSSDFNPFMYECSIRTTSVANLKDGSKGNIITRNKWRFTFDDGAPAEFYLYKHTERIQADATPGEDQEEDPGMYTKLQQTLRETLKTSIVKSVTVQ